MDKNSKIYIAGHRGLVGSAIVKSLEADGYKNLIVRTHSELDLIDSTEVAKFFEKEKPEYVILAAAKVGGIVANNTYRGEFIYDNLMIQNNIVHHSFLNKVKKLLFLGSTCIYPKDCEQPMQEDALLTGSLEYTNEPYAIAKIAGIKLCESYNLQYGTNYISVMPTNLYGPNDNFDLEKSHVMPALVRKMHLAKAVYEDDWKTIRKDLEKTPIDLIDENSSKNDICTVLSKFGIEKTSDSTSVEIWGSGKPRREFLWSEDMADACIFIMKNRNFVDTYTSNQKEIRNTHINIGTGVDISIKELAVLIKNEIGFKGTLVYNANKPDGTMKKLTDVSKLHKLGWQHKIDLENGVKKYYQWYLEKN